MLCLGIETSCDETALALVRDGKCVESVLATQMDVHALFGGVVPEIASREHYRFLGALYDELMRRTGLTLADVDVVAVTRGLSAWPLQKGFLWRATNRLLPSTISMRICWPSALSMSCCIRCSDCLFPAGIPIFTG